MNEQIGQVMLRSQIPVETCCYDAVRIIVDNEYIGNESTLTDPIKSVKCLIDAKANNMFREHLYVKIQTNWRPRQVKRTFIDQEDNEGPG